MLAHQVLDDFKENVEASSLKQSSKSLRKGLKSLSLNSVDVTKNNKPFSKIKKTISESNADDCAQYLKEKDNSKSVFQAIKEDKESINVESGHDDWSEIENMHVYIEPDDNYEDILPKSERIQKADIDSLFFNLTYSNFEDSTEYIPSPLPEDISFDFLKCPSPELKFAVSLYDDDELLPIPFD